MRCAGFLKKNIVIHAGITKKESDPSCKDFATNINSNE
tara:strand:+ start:15404 stop:15517 length:114 start_codon:yes stop_codon:yes gene_type:complete